MTRQKFFLIALIIVCVTSFTILLSIGSEVYREAPPIPEKIITSTGEVIFTKEDIQNGQLVWRSMGGHQLGSIWGHGSYVAPDWTADWLHRESILWLDKAAIEQFSVQFEQLASHQQAALESLLRDDMRSNRFDANNNILVISTRRAEVVHTLQNYYSNLFGDNPDFQPIRENYAMKENTISTAENRQKLSAFFFWGAWAAVTERPGENYTYTNNWPHDPVIGNTPTSNNIFWSILSTVLLIAAIGALAWYHASLKVHPLPEVPTKDPLFDVKATPSQKALVKYFATAVVLFLLQILLGGITAHYAVEGQTFYGYPLAEILPYSLTRTWHTQLAVFWIATAWLGTGLYIAPALSGHEPKYQKLGVNVLWVALVIIIFGSMAGEWFAIQQYLDLDLSYWVGHQGQEYIDLGRIWQILLFLGLLIWLALVTAAIKPALTQKSEMKSVIWVLYASCVAIGLFYGAGFLQGKTTNLAIAEYWRWWVVHLWVEGFFETFATSVIALMFVRLGLIRAQSANSAVLFATVVFLTGGILGVLHHVYFTGTPTSVIAWGAMFSALEVVPLALIGFEAVETYRMRKATNWMVRYKWAFMFFVATAFWNLVGAGVLGFLINPPIALYYIQGLNTTATHSHAAFMGVYGMLGVGLMLTCLRGLTNSLSVWDDKLLKWCFWSLNLGLAGMIFMSLLPVGIIQFIASVEHGYWYARSSEIIHSELVEMFVWLRVPGDMLFGMGGLFLAAFFARLIIGEIKKNTKRIPSIAS